MSTAAAGTAPDRPHAPGGRRARTRGDPQDARVPARAFSGSPRVRFRGGSAPASGALPTARELAATAVAALDLAEAAVKVRTGPPDDDQDDIAEGGRWAGVLPVRAVFGEPRPDPTLTGELPTPPHVRNRTGARPPDR